MDLYKGRFPGHVWWLDRWKGVAVSPGDVLANPNGRSVGIDLLPAPKARGGVHPGGFTDAQMDAYARLHADICARLGRTLHALSHSDVDPIVRCNASGPWDPMIVRTHPLLLAAPAGYPRQS